MRRVDLSLKIGGQDDVESPHFPSIPSQGILKLSNVDKRLLGLKLRFNCKKLPCIQPLTTIMSQDHEGPAELEDSDSYDFPQPPTRDSTELVNRSQQNIQWKPSSRTVEETLAEGISNEDLWLLIRRFNKVCTETRLNVAGANM